MRSETAERIGLSFALKAGDVFVASAGGGTVKGRVYQIVENDPRSSFVRVLGWWPDFGHEFGRASKVRRDILANYGLVPSAVAPPASAPPVAPEPATPPVAVPLYQHQPRIPKKNLPLCGAACRDGHACSAKVRVRADGSLATRCRLHGGASTGPTSAEGRARCGAAQRERWAKRNPQSGERVLPAKLSVRSPPEVIGAVDDMARETGRTKEDIVTTAVTWYLTYHQKKAAELWSSPHSSAPRSPPRA